MCVCVLCVCVCVNAFYIIYYYTTIRAVNDTVPVYVYCSYSIVDVVTLNQQTHCDIFQ